MRNTAFKDSHFISKLTTKRSSRMSCVETAVYMHENEFIHLFVSLYIILAPTRRDLSVMYQMSTKYRLTSLFHILQFCIHP